jgi:splicing factor 45
MDGPSSAPAPSNPDPEAPEPKSSRPGQKGFAARLMSKYGWTQGSGLGANESGIVDALRFKVEKRKRKPDAEGGGFVDGGARKGKIIGGTRKGKGNTADGDAERDEEDEGPGKMSNIVLLQGMLEGMPDLQGEIEDGLAQEIGEECGEKYGRVERLYIDIPTRQVFIKFTDQISALRALNALQGRIFNGNTIVPRFYDPDKFAEGVYS